MKRSILIILICAMSIVIYKLICGLYIGGFFLPPIDQDKMERIFLGDREYLIRVKNYIADVDCDDVYISATMNMGEIHISGENMQIEDDEVSESFEKLKKRGYRVISKDGNTINFLRWSNLDNGRGVAFSIDGSEPKLQFLTKLEPLSEPNWYYYEEDFNEWKRRNEITNQTQGDGLR